MLNLIVLNKPPAMPFPTSQERKPFTIAILGGGIAGLSIAISLHKRSIPFHLYESAPVFAEVGAGVSFGPNSLRALKLIAPELYEGYIERATHNAFDGKRSTWFDFYAGMDTGLGKAGEHIVEVTTGKDVLGQCSIHRAVFLDLLVSFVPRASLSFGKRVVGVVATESGGRLGFDDGSEARASAAVGCDGVKSNVRRFVLGEEAESAHPKFTGKYAYRGLIPMTKAVDLLGDELAKNSVMWIGRHGHVLTFPIEKGKVMNVVAFRTKDDGKWNDDRWVLPMDRQSMESDFADWDSSVKKILSLMDKPDVWALFDYPPAPTYYRGRICVAGDAAHASTPHQGAGAGMALEDSYVLAALLAEVEDATELEEAFKAFDAVRRGRTQRLVKTSRECGRVFDCEGTGIEEDREAWRRDLTERHKWIWDNDLEVDFKEGLKMLKGQKARLA